MNSRHSSIAVDCVSTDEGRVREQCTAVAGPYVVALLVALASLVMSSTRSAAQSVTTLGYLGQVNTDSLEGIVSLAAAGGSSACVRGDGQVAIWGNLQNGQADVPVHVVDASQVSVGDAHVAALLANGTVVCWGLDSSGQSTVPAGLGGVIAIAAGGSHTVALK